MVPSSIHIDYDAAVNFKKERSLPEEEDVTVLKLATTLSKFVTIAMIETSPLTLPLSALEDNETQKKTVSSCILVEERKKGCSLIFCGVRKMTKLIDSRPDQVEFRGKTM